MKKVSLRELVADKIVFAALIAVYYWMWARNDWQESYATIQDVVFAFSFYYFVNRAIRLKKYKQEAVDEMAETNLKRCDSICLKIGAAAMIVRFCLRGRQNGTHDGDHRLLPDGNAGGACHHPHRDFLRDGQRGRLTMALHTKIREYRENRGMKQAELAELVGVRRETIVNLEKGRYNPSLKLAMDIAHLFDTTVEALFCYTDDEP